MDPVGEQKSHRCDPASIRLLTPEEKLQLAQAQDKTQSSTFSATYTDSSPCWGCCHCQVQVVNTADPHTSELHNWHPGTMSLRDMRQHLSDVYVQI